MTWDLGAVSSLILLTTSTALSGLVPELDIISMVSPIKGQSAPGSLGSDIRRYILRKGFIYPSSNP